MRLRHMHLKSCRRRLAPLVDKVSILRDVAAGRQRLQCRAQRVARRIPNGRQTTDHLSIYYAMRSVERDLRSASDLGIQAKKAVSVGYLR